MLGPVEPAGLETLREADAILEEELVASGWYDRVWQAFCVLLPLRTVGVMGDARTYERVAVLRVVESRDGMTADWAALPADLLTRVSNRITGEVRGVNRVVLDITLETAGHHRMGVTPPAAARPFAHLHTHTEYSLLDGMSRIPGLVRRAAADGDAGRGDHRPRNLIGAFKMHRAAREAGIKPILGCEAYVAPGSRKEKNKGRRQQHLVLLAKNETGYRNLLRLTSIAHKDGYHYKPRMDFDLLEEHHEGLIALSACPKGIVPREIVEDGDPLEVAGRYLEVFGKGNYFLEIMDHSPAGEPEGAAARLSGLERRIAEGAIQLSRRTGIPLVGTNDSHYEGRGDARAHDFRLCISTNTTYSSEKRLRFDSEEFYSSPPPRCGRCSPPARRPTRTRWRSRNGSKTTTWSGKRACFRISRFPRTSRSTSTSSGASGTGSPRASKSKPPTASARPVPTTRRGSKSNSA